MEYIFKPHYGPSKTYTGVKYHVLYHKCAEEVCRIIREQNKYYTYYYFEKQSLKNSDDYLNLYSNGNMDCYESDTNNDDYYSDLFIDSEFNTDQSEYSSDENENENEFEFE